MALIHTTHATLTVLLTPVRQFTSNQAYPITHYLPTSLLTYKQVASQSLLIITYLLLYPQFIVLPVSSPLLIISLNTFLHWDIASSQEVILTRKTQHGVIAIPTPEAEHYSAA